VPAARRPGLGEQDRGQQDELRLDRPQQDRSENDGTGQGRSGPAELPEQGDRQSKSARRRFYKRQAGARR